jgi:tRNA(His) 5'-end guanylyltransferase
MKNDKLGIALKRCEKRDSHYLESQRPVIVRIDGRAFHTVTRNLKCKKPFDGELHDAMIEAARAICNDAQNVRLAYTQSDEISILMYERTPESGQWFGNRIEKICSIAASIATYAFNKHLRKIDAVPAYFDARAFNLPVDMVQKYFYWRTKDARRNSISGLAQSMFSSKELHGKNTTQMIEMCGNEEAKWGELESWKKWGTLLVKEWAVNPLPDGTPVRRSSWVDRVNEFGDEAESIKFYADILKRDEPQAVF